MKLCSFKSINGPATGYLTDPVTSSSLAPRGIFNKTHRYSNKHHITVSLFSPPAPAFSLRLLPCPLASRPQWISGSLWLSEQKTLEGVPSDEAQHCASASDQHQHTQMTTRCTPGFRSSINVNVRECSLLGAASGVVPPSGCSLLNRVLTARVGVQQQRPQKTARGRVPTTCGCFVRCRHVGACSSPIDTS